MNHTSYGIHTHIITLLDNKMFQNSEMHQLVIIKGAPFCYIGPLGPKLFVTGITDMHRRWYRIVARDFPHFPDMRTLRKTSKVITGFTEYIEFFRTVYWHIGKEIVKERFAA